MKRLSSMLLALVCTISAARGNGAPTAVDFSLLVAGWGYQTLDLIDGSGNRMWSIPGSGGAVIDVWLLDDGSVLHSATRSIRIVRRGEGGKCEVVWQWNAAPGAEVHGCQPLPDGRILLCQSSKAAVTILEVDRETKEELVRMELTEPSLRSGKHGSNRSVRKTARGTYLYGLMDGKGGGVEVDAKGTVLHRFPGARYGVFERPGGGYLAAGGDDGAVIAYDAGGKEEWRIGRKDIPDFETMFVAQVHEFSDGRILVANWGGHHRDAAGTPCLGLIDATHKQLLWSARLKPGNRVAGFHVLPAAVPEAEQHAADNEADANETPQ